MRHPDFTRDLAELIEEYRIHECLGLDMETDTLAEHMYDSLIIMAATMHKIAGTVED